jgi:hypothetical protein
MNFSMIRFVAVAAVISLAGIAQAQGIRDAGSKVRGDYGMTPRSQTFYAAPRAVYQAPAAMAQAPVERRSFSVQPGQQSAPPMVTQQPSRAVRSFSYQPAEQMYRQSPRRNQSGGAGVRDAGSKIRGW